MMWVGAGTNPCFWPLQALGKVEFARLPLTSLIAIYNMYRLVPF